MQRLVFKESFCFFGLWPCWFLSFLFGFLEGVSFCRVLAILAFFWGKVWKGVHEKFSLRRSRVEMGRDCTLCLTEFNV